MTNMIKCLFIFYLLHLFSLPVLGSTPKPWNARGNIGVACGSREKDAPALSRMWMKDASYVQQYNTTATSAPSSMDKGVPLAPYSYARFFFSDVTYTFNMKEAGSKIIRLYFYPSSNYPGYDVSKSLITARVGDHTLLNNFSPSWATKNLKVPAFFKEFIVQAQAGKLELTISPPPDFLFAFLNGIEIFSAAYKWDENAPLPQVGSSQVTHFHQTYVYETVHRINVGGDEIPPESDSGMYRTWKKDDPYISGDGELASSDLSVRYSPEVPAYTATNAVYQTARFMGTDAKFNINHNLTWKFPVETGFTYIVRLHFCELNREITQPNQLVFNIYINKEEAFKQADVILWSDGQGIATFKEFVVTIPKAQNAASQDLWLELQPDKKSKPEFYNAFLNGVEIFKAKRGSVARPKNHP